MKKATPILAILLGLLSLSLSACDRTHAEDKEHKEHNQIAVTSAEAKDVIITQPYVCQIRSQLHTEIKALQEGYLEEISVKEGQAVKKGEVMFRVLPVLYKAKLDAEKAEAEFARLKYQQTVRLNAQKVVSDSEVSLYAAELAKAEAKLKLAEAELEFTYVRAPFDGIMDRLNYMQGSLVKKEDLLTTLFDNSHMWVYFNVPEARYLDYKALPGACDPLHPQRLTLADSEIKLVLANGKEFNQSPGQTVTVEGKFNNETGNIAFRADFPNPEGLLRHGQTGTILIRRTVKNAVVIPQRAALEDQGRRYVYVVGKDDVVHRREIVVGHEADGLFVINKGLDATDRIVLDGVRQLRDGDKVEGYEFRKPDDAGRHEAP